ncbi:rhodanese-like domain-containing protein [Stieleria varia]|uniref:Thiosulfate sulfurtransferase PspE n=1 Tax=Stieleria varia TaxID=2528005 RepID=A0A5C6AYB8_9BACT|nr:rhodanese-like domain-containing protein [Stieleria varia]TWU04411.1 Thiosulfate sulfurtransferase PspE precursor [Stieleria varia]
MRKVLICLFASAVVGCTTQTSSVSTDQDTAVSADVAPVQAGSETGTEPDVIVIDVRSQEEWDSGHVKQAVHIPHTEIAERISNVTDDKDAKIVVYCAVGGRAGKAKTKLEELGFTNVENAGGYDDIKSKYE